MIRSIASLALISVVLLSGCASVTGSKLQPVSVQTVMDNQEVMGVGCNLTNDAGKWFVTSPGSVTVNKSTDDMIVECRQKDIWGRETVVSKSNGSVWGNVLLGGGIGYIVDRNTGAGFDYPNTITVNLRRAAYPEGVPAAAVSAAATAGSNQAMSQAATAAAATAGSAPPIPQQPLQAQAGTTVQAKADPVGQDSYAVGNLTRKSGCSKDPKVVLAGKGPGYESYSVACDSGMQVFYRCEFGNCRELK